MKMVNRDGEEIYFNTVVKHGKTCYLVQAVSGQSIIGRDKQKRKTRTFSQEYHAKAWLKRNGYNSI